MSRLIQRNIPPVMFWTGAFLLTGHFFGIVGVGVTFIVLGAVCAL